MKFILSFYFLFILTISFQCVFSYSSHKARLYQLLQKRLENNRNSLELENSYENNLTGLNVNEDITNNNIHTRSNWDSGEDYYFQWANRNRRPVEYLVGRKRDTDKAVLSARDRRINGGLWRSGLVG